METKGQLMDFWRAHFTFRDIDLAAFFDVDRAGFLPERLVGQAYQDKPLPLLRGKSISQPTTVMIMTSALQVQPTDKIFEVGTGSGYQAAILAKLAAKVYSTEVIPELVHFSRQNLQRAGIMNVSVIEDDGSKGLTEEAPFDKIIVTAACSQFPPALLAQLKDGGIIVGPVGTAQQQVMIKGSKDAAGHMTYIHLGPFLFTPLYGKYGFDV